jgi:hypothetical protein
MALRVTQAVRVDAKVSSHSVRAHGLAGASVARPFTL